MGFGIRTSFFFLIVIWSEFIWFMPVLKIKWAAWWWTGSTWDSHLDNLFFSWNYKESVGLFDWGIKGFPQRLIWSNNLISLDNYTKSTHSESYVHLLWFNDSNCFGVYKNASTGMNLEQTFLRDLIHWRLSKNTVFFMTSCCARMSVVSFIMFRQ